MTFQATDLSKLSTSVTSAMTSAEAIRHAGLDWGVHLEPLTLPDGRVSSHRAVVRDTDKRILGNAVGPIWNPLQNVDLGNWFDPFVEAKLATFERAGTTRNGERVWILAKLTSGPSEIVKGDVVDKFILLANGHDGVLGARGGLTFIRPICENTLAAALKQASHFMIQHHAKVKLTLDTMREQMRQIDEGFKLTAEQFRGLAAKKMKAEQFKTYIKQIFVPSSKFLVEDGDDADAAMLESKKGDKTLATLERLLEEGKGSNLKGVRGTWWAGYNAVTDFLSHERGEDASRRLDHVWFGPGSNTNRKALKLALELA